MNLSETVAKSRTGDKLSFGRLVQKYAPLVAGTAFAVCGDFAKSEDIAQDAFVEAWKNLASLRDPEKFVSWVCTISRRRAIDHLRSRKTTGSIEQMRNEPIDKNAHSPETAMAARQHQQLIWSMLESLPETYRETMILFYRGEQSTRNVAVAMGESEATIRQRLKRGREMIRDEVTDSLREAILESTPQASFASSVVAALPAISIAAGASATTGAVATAKTTGIGTGAAGVIGASGLSAVVLGPLIGLFGGAFGTWNSWRTCEYESQQRLIVRLTILFCSGLFFFLFLLAALVALRLNGLLENSRAYTICLAGLIIGFQVLNLGWIWYSIRSYKRVGQQSKERGEPLREYARLQRDKIVIQESAFHWNARAWFGGGLGGSCWMLISAIVAWNQGDIIPAFSMTACLAIAVAFVAGLWKCQGQVAAYTAYQLLFVGLGFVTVVMLATMQFLCGPELQNRLQWTPMAWFILLIFPAMSFQFYRMQRTFAQKNQAATTIDSLKE
jgi:RNA polymerase sigma factor (sigma-70 family)